MNTVTEDGGFEGEHVTEHHSPKCQPPAPDCPYCESVRTRSTLNETTPFDAACTKCKRAFDVCHVCGIGFRPKDPNQPWIDRVRCPDCSGDQ